MNGDETLASGKNDHTKPIQKTKYKNGNLFWGNDWKDKNIYHMWGSRWILCRSLTVMLDKSKAK